MSPRLDYPTLAPEPYKAMLGLERALAGSKLPKNLIHLVKLRASQINGCAYCIDMHWLDARAGDEPERRLYELAAWREAPFYSEAERAALAWTEALTLIAETHAPDADFARLQKVFSEREIADLTWVIASINAWNRIAIGMRSEPGHYQPSPQKR